MNNSVKIFDGLDPQYTLSEESHQIDARMIRTIAKKPLDRLAYDHWDRKMAYIKCFLFTIASNWFLRLHEIYKKTRLPS